MSNEIELSDVNIIGGLRRRQHVYRDALAVKLNGQTREAVGDLGDHVDIVVDHGQRVDLWEVKYGGLSQRTGTARVRSAGFRYKPAQPNATINQKVFLIMSADNRVRARQLERIKEHQSEWDQADRTRIFQMVEVRLPEEYSIGSLFSDRKEINDYFDWVVSCYKVDGCLGRQADLFLKEMTQKAIKRLYNRELMNFSVEEYQRGIVVIAKTSRGTITLGRRDLIRNCLEFIHWEWLKHDLPVKVGG